MRKNLRTVFQFAWAALSNGFYKGFLSGRIYQGNLKKICLPGLNCYSCPGSLGSCPVGAMQATLDSGRFRIPFYAAGFLLFFGAVFGRLVCGFLCPFGLVQDLLYKIPVPAKLRTLPFDRVLRRLKYLILLLFVIVLPLAVTGAGGQGKPWFCQYICPSGTLFGGIPLLAANEPLREAVGLLFSWKAAVLLGILAASLFLYRPFCRYLCPLGAIYGFFNQAALLRYQFDPDSCIHCGKCTEACPMRADPEKNVNSAECIRCGICREVCPTGSIRLNMQKKEVPASAVRKQKAGSLTEQRLAEALKGSAGATDAVER